MAEGPKVVRELLDSGIRLHSLYTTAGVAEWPEQAVEVSEAELRKLSALKNPGTTLGVFYTPQSGDLPADGLVLALDTIRDPGNLGTIVRLADWFGISDIVCSQDTVDCFNPKVVQATMGSIARVSLHYLDLEEFLRATDLPIYGGFMNADSVYQQKLPEDAILVLGNEGQGISKPIETLVNHQIAIPRFGELAQTESLNVAMAAAILINEFRRPIGR